MFRNVARLSLIAAGTSLSLLFISTTSAASIAISVPAPIAMPMSALVSAGASFMPSPTIATRPFAASSLIAFSLPSGSTPAITSSTPACFPIARAVRSLSPVSMTTRIPMLRSLRTACGLSSFMTSATAIIPKSFPALVNSMGVLPCSASDSVTERISAGTPTCPSIKSTLPPTSFSPSS